MITSYIPLPGLLMKMQVVNSSTLVETSAGNVLVHKENMKKAKVQNQKETSGMTSFSRFFLIIG